MSDVAYTLHASSTGAGEVIPVKRRRAKPAPQPELPSRKTLDLRFAANKQFNQIVARITAEIGGEISTVQRHLIEAFAGTAVIADAINVRTLLGQPIDDDLIEALAASSTAASTLVSLSQRIGRAKGDEQQHNAVEA